LKTKLCGWVREGLQWHPFVLFIGMLQLGLRLQSL